MKRILIVEDDEIIALGLVYALEQEGFVVVHRNSVYEALNIIKREKFDLAILDIQLPDGIGFEISEKLKDTNTSIIFLTIFE